LEILKWLRRNECPWDSQIYYTAAEYGHLEVLKWLRKKGYRARMEICIHKAAGIVNLEVLEWTIENGSSWNEYACFYAACGGHLEILKRYAQR
jgi:hypothetical protein